MPSSNWPRKSGRLVAGRYQRCRRTAPGVNPDKAMGTYDGASEGCGPKGAVDKRVMVGKGISRGFSWGMVRNLKTPRRRASDDTKAHSAHARANQEIEALSDRRALANAPRGTPPDPRTCRQIKRSSRDVSNRGKGSAKSAQQWRNAVESAYPGRELAGWLEVVRLDAAVSQVLRVVHKTRATHLEDGHAAPSLSAS
jgi:hypothetical protein